MSSVPPRVAARRAVGPSVASAASDFVERWQARLVVSVALVPARAHAIKPRLCHSKLVASLPQVRLGVDGIYIRSHDRSGCFLPQVAPEQGWDVEQTLTAGCAHKMGLAEDAWRAPTDLQFYCFQAIVFGESSPGKLQEVSE